MKRTASSSTTALAPIVDHQTLTEVVRDLHAATTALRAKLDAVE
jgi:hypothetical protein